MKILRNENLIPIFIGGICVAIMLILFSIPLYSYSDTASESQKVIGITLKNFTDDANLNLYQETLHYTSNDAEPISFIIKNAANDPIAQKKNIEDLYTQMADQILVIPCNRDFLIQSLREINGPDSIIWIMDISNDSYTLTNVQGEKDTFSSAEDMYDFLYDQSEK